MHGSEFGIKANGPFEKTMLLKFDIEIVHKTFFFISTIKNGSIVITVFMNHEISFMSVKSHQLSLQLDIECSGINDFASYINIFVYYMYESSK